jgi:hypothetical protein|tara:strand:- start:13776 stop:14108 length:333 start_codon:yes stop_codon:yes gene_type:complete
MRHENFGQHVGNKDVLMAARLRKRFNRACRVLPGDLVTINGKTGDYNGISVHPGSKEIHVRLYRSEGDLGNARAIEIADNFRVSVGVIDRPEIKPHSDRLDINPPFYYRY